MNMVTAIILFIVLQLVSAATLLHVLKFDGWM